MAEEKNGAPAATLPEQGPAPATRDLPATRPAGSSAPVRMGVVPTTVDEGWRMAQLLAKSTLVPENFRNKPEDILVAIQMGIEIGFAPMQALQSIAVINGRPSVWGDGFLALLMSSPLYADHDEYYEVKGERRAGLTVDELKLEDTAAVCTFWRRGKRGEVTRRFTVGQARKAGLINDPKRGPWQNYPDRMLAMRARSWAGRDTFPDLLRGIRTAEEAVDNPDDNALETTQPAREVRRMSETVQAAPQAVQAGGTVPIVMTDPPAPPADEVRVGPASVRDVQQFLGGYALILESGEQIDVTDEPDALELEKFKGSKHRVTLVCTRITDGLRLKTFAMVD